MKIGVLEPEDFSVKAIEKLSTVGVVVVYTGGNVSVFLKDLDVLFIRLGYFIDSNFLQYSKKLKFLCSPTTGHNHIDLKYLNDKNIELVSLRGEREFLNTIRATPEHTFGLILSLIRNYKAAFIHVGLGRWDRDSLKGSELYGKNVGIIGMGRVGMLIAQYCRLFGSKISYFDINKVSVESDFFSKDSVGSLIESADIVVLCASYDKGMGFILDKEEVKLLKGKFLINTARGELINEKYLIHAIEEGGVSGVALDVISNEEDCERVKKWSKLSEKYSNLIVTPHIAGATVESMERTEVFIVEKLINFLKNIKDYYG
jgi:D-3-phosphoglycerate dehydrogenase / 2-oxoglutarate reductase